MNAVIERLENTFKLSLKDIETNAQSKLAIGTRLNGISATKREEIIEKHTQIKLEYQLACQQIHKTFNQASKEEKIQSIEALLKLAELLDIIYQDYLAVPREYERFQEEERVFRKWLYQSDKNAAVGHQYTSKYIREKTGNYNLLRLFIIRIRRFVLASTKLASPNSSYNHIIANIDRYAAPFFNYLAWIIFIPRITINLAMLLKHTIPNLGMTKGERELSLNTRLHIQLAIRFGDLSNDLAWFTANMIGCFFVVGPLSVLSVNFLIMMQVYELIQVALVSSIELTNLRKQQKTYEQLLIIKNTDEHALTYENIQNYLTHIENQIKYEKKRLSIPFLNASVLLIAAILASSLFAFNPLFAVAGGIVAVSITIIAFLGKKYIEKQKPNGNILNLLEPPEPPPTTPKQHGFFSAKKINPKATTEKNNKPCYSCIFNPKQEGRSDGNTASSIQLH